MVTFVVLFTYRHTEKDGQMSDVMTFSRFPEESVRSTTGKRKKQRERKKEREELEIIRKREEIKRLKAMRKKGVASLFSLVPFRLSSLFFASFL